MTTTLVPADPPVLGRTVPRLFTPPLITGPPGPCGCGCALTPATSYGFAVIRFARIILGRPLDPWQEWTVIHAGELLPDGRPRFRQLLILVARQNGKTELLVVLTLYWLWVEKVAMVLGTSTKLDYAAESWRKACRLARRSKRLRSEIPRKGGIRKANGEQVLWRADAEEYELDDGSRYKVAASNEEGGRSLTIDKLVLDELRHHYDYSAWEASVPATIAVRHAQVIAITNAGSEKSVVLNDTRDDALAFIKSGEGDERLGLIEYSAPEGSSPLDLEALAMANPNLGRRVDALDLLGMAKRAVKKGGDALAGFLTEYMCMSVKRMNPAIDPDSWRDCLDPGTLDGVRDRLAAFLDVSRDGLHATLAVAAVLEDGRVRVEVVQAWSGPGCAAQVGREIAGALRKIKPRAFGWMPSGPAAVVAANLADRSKKAKNPSWPPRGVVVEEVRAEVAAVCMGFSALVDAKLIAQSGQELLDTHVGASEKLWRGDAWVFGRRGAGHVDATYAGAGAAHLARTLPPSMGKPRLVGEDDDA